MSFTVKCFHHVVLLVLVLLTGALASSAETESLESLESLASSHQTERSLIDVLALATACRKLTKQWKTCKQYCGIKRQYHSCFKGVTIKNCPIQVAGLNPTERKAVIIKIKALIKPNQVSEDCRGMCVLLCLGD